jgi:hypothetical protein
MDRSPATSKLPPAILRVLTHGSFAVLLAFAWVSGRRPSDDQGPDEALKHGFHLSECGAERGVKFRHTNCRLDPKLDNIAVQVAGVGAAVSVADVDGDGWADLYATSSDFGTPNGLFLNQRDGTFRDVAASAGLADLNRPGEGASMGSIWADYDNDGNIDCFVYKYGYPQLFHNDGRTGERPIHFTDVTEQAGLRRWMNANGATWIDYDRDGFLDLYVAGYFREDIDLWNLKTTKIMQDSFDFAKNGGHKHLYHNLGQGRFEEVTDKMGVDSTRWTLAVAAADLNGDGWQDLYLANDYGAEELFINDGGKRFLPGIRLDESSKSGMAVALGDVENNGRLSVYVTNISNPFLMQGDNLRLNRLQGMGGTLLNVARGVAENCGWAWGAQFGDLNNDGRTDLVVVNGFVSASKERDYWYAMTKLSSGAGRLAEDSANWPVQGDRSLSGYELSRVLVNVTPYGGNSPVRFVDAAQSVGMTDLYDGRAVSYGDLFHRGALDVVIANQNGPLLLYCNEVDRDRHWIQFELTGTRSNRSAVGAQVTVHFDGRQTIGAVLAGSGFCSQNELALHFGLGDTTNVDRAVIRWPSGESQSIDHPAVDQRHKIREP